jgi:hypothetical protein
MELPALPLCFPPKTSWLAENGHQSAEFRQGLAKALICYEKRDPPNSLIYQQINNINDSWVWQGSCLIKTGCKSGVREWTFDRGGP